MTHHYQKEREKEYEKNERRVREEDRKMVELATGIGESIALVAAKYRRRPAPLRQVDVNHSLGPVISPPYLQPAPPPVPSDSERLAASLQGDGAAALATPRPLPPAQERRQQLEQYWDKSASGSSIVSADPIEVAKLVRGIADRGTSSRGTDPEPAGAGSARAASDLPIPSVNVPSDEIEIALGRLWPFKAVDDTLYAIDTEFYGRMQTRPRDGMPGYLRPMELVLNIPMSLGPSPKVPRTRAENFVTEVRSGRIPTIVLGLSQLLAKRLAEIKSFPPEGPEGGGSIKA